MRRPYTGDDVTFTAADQYVVRLMRICSGMGSGHSDLNWLSARIEVSIILVKKLASHCKKGGGIFDGTSVILFFGCSIPVADHLFPIPVAPLLVLSCPAVLPSCSR